MYNFALHINSDPSIAVHPVWPDSVVRNYDKENGEQFYRNKLSGKFTFVRSEFDTMLAAPFDARFRLVIERNDNPSVTFWEGYFYKTDCSWDEDSRLVEVQPITLDLYDDVLSGKDKEFDLIQLSPEIERLRYKKQPLIQLYLKGASLLKNVLSGNTWETPVSTPVFTSGELTTFGFAKGVGGSSVRTIVPTDGTLNPDISGQYLDDEAGNIERDDSAYGFVFGNLGNGNRWNVVDRNDSDTVVYEGILADSDLFGAARFKDQGTLLTSVTSASTCRVFQAELWSRFLTDLDEVNTVPTTDLPSPDITNEEFGYKKYVGLGATRDNFNVSDGHQVEPTRFGRIAEDSTLNAREYFTQYQTGTSETPILLHDTEWTEASWWFYYTPFLRDIQEDAATDIVLKHAYPLGSVINQLLGQISTGITYEETTAFSDFLNNTSGNPVSFDKYIRLFITPKSNIKVGNYDHPATKAAIKFIDVMTMLKTVYNCYWHIDETNRFRIEHVSWYMNGGSYPDVNIGYDLTLLIEAKTRKRWSFKSKKYTYDKDKLPEQLKYSWMDKVSRSFDGYNIEVNSSFVQKGNIEEKRSDMFTTDLDFAQAQASSISNDGFMLLAGNDLIDSEDYIVNFKELTANNEAYKVQNGELSNIHLHPSYHKHNLPAPDVTINNEATTATTVKRYKSQEITFPVGTDPDPMQLIETDLGQGKLDKLEINLVTSAAKATIKHDQ